MEAILQKIKPTQGEEAQVQQRVEGFLRRLGTEAVIGGSFAKGTWLAGDHDVDVFVFFPKEEKELAEKLGRLLRRNFRHVVRVHGSRDYYQVKEEGVTFEVVPVLKIARAEEAENITDVSPLHVTWVKAHSNNFLKDQVRLAKQFCKAQKVYGAETYIKGFSGYVLEILVIYYGNFAKLLKHALHWKEGMIIDAAGHYRGGIREKAALIVVDPVQPTRNAAAALSPENMQKFKDAARAFLRRPTIEAFVEKYLAMADLRKNDLVLQVTPLPGKRDNVGTKLLKAFEYCTKKLEEEGFAVVEKGWEWDDVAYFWYRVKSKKLSGTKRHEGPPLTKKKNVTAFKRKYAKFHVRTAHGRLYVLLPRKYQTLQAYARALLKEEELRKRVRKIVMMGGR